MTDSVKVKPWKKWLVLLQLLCISTHIMEKPQMLCIIFNKNTLWTNKTQNIQTSALSAISSLICACFDNLPYIGKNICIMAGAKYTTYAQKHSTYRPMQTFTWQISINSLTTLGHLITALFDCQEHISPGVIPLSSQTTLGLFPKYFICFWKKLQSSLINYMCLLPK